MAKQREAQFKQKVVSKLREIPNSWWLTTNPIWSVGVPDILGWVAGQPYGIELKIGDNKASPKQMWELGKMCHAGAKIFVCNEESFDAVLKEILEGRRNENEKG